MSILRKLRQFLFLVEYSVLVCFPCSEMEAVLLELTRVVAERDALAAQVKADAVTMKDKIQQATKQGTSCLRFYST